VLLYTFNTIKACFCWESLYENIGTLVVAIKVVLEVLSYNYYMKRRIGLIRLVYTNLLRVDCAANYPAIVQLIHPKCGIRQLGLQHFSLHIF